MDVGSKTRTDLNKRLMKDVYPVAYITSAQSSLEATQQKKYDARQCPYNVTMRRVPATIVAVEQY